MKIFITGGAGFIGREVVKQLLQTDNNVLIYDDFSFGRENNLEEFRKNKQLEVVKGKIENHAELLTTMEAFQPTIIIHLAAIHFIPFCNSHPLDTIRINVEGTHSVFEAAVKCNVKRVLFASSGAIYSSEEHELLENKDIPSPVDIYGISKLLCEHSGKYYSEKYKIETIAMRFFNTYGPYETNEHLIPEIMKQLQNGNILNLGNIKTKRDYIYTEDIARGIICLANSSLAVKHEIVNIGAGIEYSAEEIVQTISNIIGKPIDIQIDENKKRNSDKMHQIAGINHIKNITGWEPRVSLKEGLEYLLKYEKLI